MSLNSLKEAVLVVVEEMLHEADDLKDKPGDAAASYLRDSLKGHARALRLIVQAAGEEAPAPALPQPLTGLFVSPQAQHEREIEKEREKIRREKRAAMVEESYDGDMVEVMGGPVSPDNTPVYQSISPSMQIGNFTELSGAVYQLQQAENNRRRLVFHEAQTARLHQLRSNR